MKLLFLCLLWSSILSSSFCFFDPTFGNSSYPKYNETALEAEFLELKTEQEGMKFLKPKVEENELLGRRFKIKKNT